MRPSLGSVGDVYADAMVASWFATLECELLARRRFMPQAEARLAMFMYIEGFYNLRRRRSALGYLSPMSFERAHAGEAWSPSVTKSAAVLAAVKDKPSRTAKWPSLTAAPRDGLHYVGAGTEGWAPQGPNKRMAPRQKRKSTPP